MDALALMIAVFVGYLLMYRFYGKYIGSKVFALSKEASVPSAEMEDGVDYVPTRKEIIFGHHFTSIAGTGPIVGPAIAVIWGWLPAIIWVFVGSVIMGAVHDFGALIISMRNKGVSVSEYTSRYINSRTKAFFFFVVFLELLIIIAIFGLVIAVIFAMYPGSVLAVWLEIPIAIWLGYMVYKRGGSLTTYSILAVLMMYAAVALGLWLPLKMPTIAGIPATGVWTIILLAYAYIASTLPVTTLLQPRDFINSHQLFVAFALLILGVLTTSLIGGDLNIVAPAYNATPEKAPPLWPFLFITIACGAISGFHSLVSSGTSAKQVRNEDDALFVGYGSMLMEATLSTLVIIACVAGIGLGYMTKGGELLTGVPAYTQHYASWAAAAGLGSKITAFVVGSANMIASFGLPKAFAILIMGVFVASFAGTTLDSATRIQRYILTEAGAGLGWSSFKNKHVTTLIAVVTAGILAFSSGADGKGALALWPLFGATNQTLAALVLIVITLYLKQNGKAWWISAAPAAFMSVMTIWALILNQFAFVTQHNILLQIINAVILLLAIWIIIEGIVRFVTPEKKEREATTS
jgi:carbon starvation protein